GDVEALAAAADEAVTEAVEAAECVVHRVEAGEMSLEGGRVGRVIAVGDGSGVFECRQQGFEFPPLAGADDQAEQVPHVLFGLEEFLPFAPWTTPRDDPPVGEGSERGRDAASTHLESFHDVFGAERLALDEEKRVYFGDGSRNTPTRAHVGPVGDEGILAAIQGITDQDGVVIGMRSIGG
ncbi:hypothetical protein OAG01_01155, partial [bacterium]|nr:hypothetical protein [bacterium]MDB4633029.1 hypothetical protein [bacterium]